MKSVSVPGIDELYQAAMAVGLIPGVPESDDGADLVAAIPGGGLIRVQVKRLSLVAGDGLEKKIGRWDTERPRGDSVSVLVADRITEDARRTLQRAGWGWLDLRGHLHIAGHGLFIDSDVPPAQPLTSHPNPLAGDVGIEVASLLLLHPEERMSVRNGARMLKRAPSSVSDALKAFREAGLADESRRPAVPDLFWELAGRWKSAQADVASPPLPGKGAVNAALKLGLEDPVDATTGWALTDTTAAARYGAPVSARADHPPDFFVPDQAILRRAVKLLGTADDPDRRGARLKVAPVAMICANRLQIDDETWPMAQPLFVALDLAQDHGRGREILAGWTPTRGHRVW
jgi:hypothetical protein